MLYPAIVQTIEPVQLPDFRRLSEQIDRVLERDRRTRGGEADAVAIGGAEGFRLARGVVHEWFDVAAEGEGEGEGGRPAAGHPWLPPLCLFAHIVTLTLAAAPAGWALWIGRRCWPTPHALFRCGGRPLLARSIFVDPPDERSRLMAIDLAVRCPAAAAVVGDGSGLSMAASRRFQVAAGEGRALVMLARPAHEAAALSAAAARWAVRCVPSDRDGPRWTVELLRCKGVRPADGAQRPWTAEWRGHRHHHHGTGALAVSSDVARGPAEAPRPAGDAPASPPAAFLRTA